MKKLFVFLMSSIILNSCAGYKVEDHQNPLINYEISSISVPVFINNSILPNASAPLTKEIVLMFSEFTGLKIIPGESRKADAILVGIVESDQYTRGVYETNSTKVTSGELETAIGNRNQFNLPSSTKIGFSLRLILIKDPNIGDLKLIKSNLGKYVKVHPKVIFNKSIKLQTVYSREIKPGVAGEVNFTKNKGFQENAISRLGKDAALEFKEVILNAF
jgi:hypothetical protein